MERVTLLVRNLIVIAMLATILDLLVPPGEMRRWVRMVVGLLITVALVQALTGFVHRKDFALPAISVAGNPGVVNPDYREFQERYAARALTAYQEGVARQVKALAGLAGLDVARVEVVCETEEPDYPRLREIRLHLRQAVPALSQEGGPAVRAAGTIADFYNLPRQKVVVTVP
jgi:stage III sporulation protein AF